MDLIFLGLVFAFFGMSFLFVYGCNLLGKSQ